MKKQVLMVVLLGATVSYLHGAEAAGQTTSSLQEGIDQVFDKLYEVQESLLNERLIGEAQQARLRQLAAKRGNELQDPKALLEMASDLLGVLEAATKSKKTNLVTNFDTIKSRIADLTRQEEQQKEQRQVDKLPQQTPAAPPVAQKPKKTPPVVAAKPVKKPEAPAFVVPIPVIEPVAAEEGVVAEEQVEEPVVSMVAASVAARPASVMLVEDDSDDDVVLIRPRVLVGNESEDEVIVLTRPSASIAEEEDEDDVVVLAAPVTAKEEPAAAVVLPATMTLAAAPAIALAIAEPVRVANAEREAVLERVLGAQLASATQWGAAEPGKPWAEVEGKTLFAGIHQIPGFQFLNEEQQAAFDPARKTGNTYQKAIAAPAANVVIELLQSDGMGYPGANRKYRLGERSRSGQSYLDTSVITSALRETLSEYSVRSWLTNPMVLQVLQKVSQPGFEPNSRIENEVKAKNAFDDAVRAILALDDLFAQQLRFKSEEHQALMRDIELFRTQGGNRDDLRGRIQRAMTRGEELEARWAAHIIEEELARMVELSVDQRGTIASVIRELAGVERAAVAHAAVHALAAERPVYTPEERLRIFTEFMTTDRRYSDFEIWTKLFREVEVLTLYRDLMAQVPHGQNPVFGNVMDEAKFKMLREFENPANGDALNKVLKWYMVANNFDPQFPHHDRDKEAKLLTAIVDKYRQAIHQLFAQNGEKIHNVLMALDINPFSPHHAKMQQVLERINRERGQGQTTQGIEALRTHLLGFDPSIHTLQGLVDQKLVPLDKATEGLARAGHDPEKLLLTIVEQYPHVLENTLWGVQAKTHALVSEEDIRDYLTREFQDKLHYQFLNVLAHAIFERQGSNYSHHALGRFFYINRDTLQHESTLLGSMFGISADVLQQELQKSLANVDEEQLSGIVRNLLTQNGLTDILGQHVGQIVEFLTALRGAPAGQGYDLVSQFFPAQ